MRSNIRSLRDRGDTDSNPNGFRVSNTHRGLWDHRVRFDWYHGVCRKEKKIDHEGGFQGAMLCVYTGSELYIDLGRTSHMYERHTDHGIVRRESFVKLNKSPIRPHGPRLALAVCGQLSPSSGIFYCSNQGVRKWES